VGNTTTYTCKESFTLKRAFPQSVTIIASDSANNKIVATLNLNFVKVALSAILTDDQGKNERGLLEFLSGVSDPVGLLATISADLESVSSSVRIKYPSSENDVVLRNNAMPISVGEDLSQPLTTNVFYRGIAGGGGDNSPVQLKIDANHPDGPKTRETMTFTVRLPKLEIIDEGTGAVAAQIAKNSDSVDFASFGVKVSEGTIALNPRDIYVTVGNPVTLDTLIRVTASSDAAVTIAQGTPANSYTQVVDWNGLTVSSDVAGQISFRGTPLYPIAGQVFRAFLKSSVESPVAIAYADFTVHVASGKLSLNPSHVTIVSNETADEAVEVLTGSEKLGSLRLTMQNGTQVPIWNGLTISADVSKSQITVKGSPTVDRGSITVVVAGTSDKGAELGSDNLTIEIVPPDSHTLVLNPATLHPIVGEAFMKDVADTATPAISLTGLKIDGQTTVDWNGLRIDVISGFNIRVSGTPEGMITKSFVVTGTAADPIRTALLTISVHEPDSVSRQRATGQHINIEEGSYLSKVPVRKHEIITLTCWGSLTVDSVVGIDQDGRQEWLNGPSDGSTSTINVNVYPTQTGFHTLRINYTRSGIAYYQLAPYRVVLAEEELGEGSKGGCRVAGTGLALLALCLGPLRKRR
jgi:hypothetical protein